MRGNHVSAIESRLEELRGMLAPSEKNGPFSFELGIDSTAVTSFAFVHQCYLATIHNLAAIWNTNNTLFKTTGAPDVIQCCTTDAWLFNLEYGIDSGLPIISYSVPRTGTVYGVARICPEHAREWEQHLATNAKWSTLQELFSDPWVLDAVRGEAWQEGIVHTEHLITLRSAKALDIQLFDLQDNRFIRNYKSEYKLCFLQLALAGFVLRFLLLPVHVYAGYVCRCQGDGRRGGGGEEEEEKR